MCAYYTSMVHNVLLTEVRLIILVKVYLLFICLFVVALVPSRKRCTVLSGKDFFPPRSLSPLCISEQRDPEIEIKKIDLGYQIPNHLRKQRLCLGFQTAFVKLMGLWLWSIFCKESWRNKRGGISHVCANDCGLDRYTPKDGLRKTRLELETAWKEACRILEDDFFFFFLGLKEICRNLTLSTQYWNAYGIFLNRAFPDYLVLNSWNTNCPVVHWTLIIQCARTRVCTRTCLLGDSVGPGAQTGTVPWTALPS